MLPMFESVKSFLLCYIAEIYVVWINISVQNFFTLPVHYCRLREWLKKKNKKPTPNLPKPTTVMSVRAPKNYLAQRDRQKENMEGCVLVSVLAANMLHG